jgi:hypothetical protein
MLVDAIASGRAVAVPIPDLLAGVVERLRSMPQLHVGDPDAGAVAAGVVFGRADHVSAWPTSRHSFRLGSLASSDTTSNGQNDNPARNRQAIMA